MAFLETSLAILAAEMIAGRLVSLGSLDPYGSHEVARDDAAALAEELNVLPGELQDGELGTHLDAMLGIVPFCRDSPEPSWLSVIGP